MMFRYTHRCQRAISRAATIVGPVTLLAACSGYVPSTPNSTLVKVDAERAGLLFDSGFEGDSWPDWNAETCCVHSATLVELPAPVRMGSSAMRFEVRRNDPILYGGVRAELKIPGDTGITGGVGDERWFGVSIFIPQSWQTESRIEEIILQWHARPDFDLGESWRSPPLSFRVSGDRLRIRSIWDPKARTEGNDPTPEGGRDIIWEGSYTKGTWADWVVHARWSYRQDGLLEIWRDGVKLVDRIGPNTYNDQEPLYLKMGLYVWRWTTDVVTPIDKRTIYHDEVRVGGPDAGYDSVMPGR